MTSSREIFLVSWSSFLRGRVPFLSRFTVQGEPSATSNALKRSTERTRKNWETHSLLLFFRRASWHLQRQPTQRRHSIARNADGNRPAVLYGNAIENSLKRLDYMKKFGF
ncbi:hypothetical protein GE061_019525 [Apolygus lucorum]|uniref:Uncharacterized protein n=1 Tax=Apolygus lucorum TaxID=248454 RepID=A0A8S9XA12_APOLU|nr:hypothetical protein GE061_019525 [Apolygus lucorum]